MQTVLFTLSSQRSNYPAMMKLALSLGVNRVRAQTEVNLLASPVSPAGACCPKMSSLVPRCNPSRLGVSFSGIVYVQPPFLILLDLRNHFHI